MPNPVVRVVPGIQADTCGDRGGREFVHPDHAGLGRLESLSVKEVAELWHVAEKTVRREIARGNLRAVNVGRAVRIPVSVLEEFVVGGEVC